MAPVGKQADVGAGAFAPACIAAGESSVEALQRVEAECGWSDAPWLMAQALENIGDETWATGGVSRPS